MIRQQKSSTDKIKSPESGKVVIFTHGQDIRN